MIANKFDAFLFDLDGVIYVGKEVLPEAAESLEVLRKNSKVIRFLTNNPCTTRAKIAKRLNSLGIEAYSEEVITAAWATAQYLRAENIKTVFVLGDDNLKWECEQVGINIDEENDVEAVVVSWDDDLCFHHIKKAVKLINGGAKFIGTNVDRNFPSSDGILPGVGPIVEAVKMASEKEPVVIGKPYPYIFKQTLKGLREGLRVLMIGDNPCTDILGAHQIGISTALIADKVKYKFPYDLDFRNADVVIPNLKSLFDKNIDIREWKLPHFPWPNDGVKAGVAGIILDENTKVLLMKRVDNGLWGIPSGHIEPGETVEQAIIREVREETGLEVEVVRLIGVYSDPNSQVFSYPNGKVSHFITTCFQCKVVGGTFTREGEETLDADYFNVDNLPEQLLTMHPRWIKDALNKEKISYIR